MKNSVTSTSLIILSSLFLFSCNSSDPTSEQSEETKQSETIDSTSEAKSTEEVSSEETETDDEDNVLAKGEFDDQLELAIGDTGRVDTLSGAYGVTVDRVELLEDIDGELPELDHFLLVTYTVQNIGDEDLDAREAVDSLESTHRLEGSGYSDNAQYYDQFNAIEGMLAPDEQVTGEALYSAYDSEEYFLRVTDGLVGSGAAKNQIRFSFQKGDIE
ncbi:hypothetical protein [Alkalicoccobacillus gibsonii]|uniref:hypothetical protein n=1 Tax=Alkalicoccobacillus gibsonii TaxID=79881 RepID=UPI0019325F26|nr:hypothetical protein [Alkalicoccobacillus gibsonii]MBM0066642.1 hypothetical protein [Alkalicoccobacillus gibsonii]